ncbi:hypothetical protein J6X04_02335 [Candidatus Saccharibacteria bacterium]|nr:hypothetical protein [Candidatus Saccharibacteria bacterium]
MDKKKKKIISFAVFTIGLAVLVAGAVFLVLNLTRGTDIADGEYLVSVGKWTLADEVSVRTCTDEYLDPNCGPEEGEETTIDNRVVWNFTEIGKGTLTTNAHENDYDFIWAIEDGKLKIETKWLYDLENEYDYKLDQKAGELILSADGEEYKFVAEQ